MHVVPGSPHVQYLTRIIKNPQHVSRIVKDQKITGFSRVLIKANTIKVL